MLTLLKETSQNITSSEIAYSVTNHTNFTNYDSYANEGDFYGDPREIQPIQEKPFGRILGECLLAAYNKLTSCAKNIYDKIIDLYNTPILPGANAAETYICTTNSCTTENVKCKMPEGNYKDSCECEEPTTYISSDPNVPQICKLRCKCKTTYESMEPIENEVFIPSEVVISGIENNNGTLSSNNRPLLEKNNLSSQTITPACKIPPEGTYKKSCYGVNVTRYESSDPNLKKVEFCELRGRCRPFEHYMDAIHKSNLIYFEAFKNKDGTVIDNCNGKLFKFKDSNDCRCQGVTNERVIKYCEERRERGLRCAYKII